MMGTAYGIDLPPGLRAEFAGLVRGRIGADANSPGDIRVLFNREYLIRTPTVMLLLRCAAGRGAWWLGLTGFRLRRQELIRQVGHDAAASCADRLRAMGIAVRVLDTHWARAPGSRQVTVCVRCEAETPVWGVGVARDPVTASRRAVLSAVSRSRPEALRH
jgi:hypothetical protein